MISKYKYKGLLWIDLQSPRREEIQSILEEFNLPEDLEQKIYTESPEPSTDIDPHFTYSVLYFPSILSSQDCIIQQEIDFIIGKNFLITVHYEPINVLDNFAKKFEAEELLGANIKLENSASLFYYLIQTLNDDTKATLASLSFKKGSNSSILVPILCIIIVILAVFGIIQYLK